LSIQASEKRRAEEKVKFTEDHTEAEPQQNNRISHSKDTARTSSQQDRKGHKD
jgi:hypothetical protein